MRFETHLDWKSLRFMACFLGVAELKFIPYICSIDFKVYCTKCMFSNAHTWEQCRRSTCWWMTAQLASAWLRRERESSEHTHEHCSRSVPTYSITIRSKHFTALKGQFKYIQDVIDLWKYLEVGRDLIRQSCKCQCNFFICIQLLEAEIAL